MTEEEAKAILKLQFGSRDCMLNLAASAQPAKVVSAVIKLGGAYQAGWGITKLPEWYEKD